jgi:hypothetical protein
MTIETDTMNDCLVVYAALSQVKRVKKVLETENDYFDIVRSPHCLAVGGCSYAIRCAEADIPRLESATRRLGIEWKGVFRERNTQGVTVYEPISGEN